jgi:hypothetical protein
MDNLQCVTLAAALLEAADAAGGYETEAARSYTDRAVALRAAALLSLKSANISPTGTT